MGREHLVVIGNGPAANQAALTLRERSPGARITMIGRDRTGFYRPDLLPDYIAGKLSEANLYVNPGSFYGERGIKLRLGQEVVQADFGRCELTLDHKERIRFDGLIIAVGGRPRIPAPLGVFEDLMLTLKTVADAAAWRETLSRVDSVLVMGGDLTSLAFTSALLSLGKRVAFALDAGCFWPVRLADRACGEVRERLRGKGIEVLESGAVRNMARVAGDRIAVETDAGRIEVGAVGAFFGLAPDVGFLVGSGLHIERGILVDEHLKTPFEGVYAAGDCAQVFHPELRDYWVSIGYSNARNLGKIAACNLTGSREAARVAPESIFEVEGVSVNTSWWTEF